MQVIVGLGNPGDKYKKTRHNAGFRAVEAMARKENLTWKENKRFKAEIAEGSGVLFLKPLTFMNNSGQAVSSLLSYFKMAPFNKGGQARSTGGAERGGFQKEADLSELLTVIHDDLDIDLGKYKISVDSRSAGHNGVQSIIDSLGTKNFRRVRIGIRTPKLKLVPAEKFVLENFTEEEAEIITKLIEGLK